MNLSLGVVRRHLLLCAGDHIWVLMVLHQGFRQYARRAPTGLRLVQQGHIKRQRLRRRQCCQRQLI